MPDLVSIVMPAFNAQGHVAEAIESVLAQSHAAWELLVVDDGSRDRTVDIVGDYARRDARIRLTPLGRNSGPAVARNTGIQLARGRYIGFLDSDDLWFPHKLAVQIAALEAHSAPLCYSAYEIWKARGARTQVYQVPRTTTYRQMLRGSVIGCSTVLLDVSRLGKRFFPSRDEILQRSWYGRFIRTIGHEDYALWLSILRDFEARGMAGAVGVPEPLVRYRLLGTSFSSQKLKAALFQWIVYREFERLGLWASVGNFLVYGARGIARRLL